MGSKVPKIFGVLFKDSDYPLCAMFKGPLAANQTENVDFVCPNGYPLLANPFLKSKSLKRLTISFHVCKNVLAFCHKKWGTWTVTLSLGRKEM